MKQFTLTIAVALATLITRAQGTIWQNTDLSILSSISINDRLTIPAKFDLYEINPTALSQKLVNAVDRFAVGAPIKVDFPVGNDQFETFNVYKSGAMEPALEAAYPNLRSYYGFSNSNVRNKIYFSITPQGFRGLVTGEHILYMDPYAQTAANTIMVYDRKNLSRGTDDPFECHVDDTLSQSATDLMETTVATKAFRDGLFRTYRMAIAATSAYTAYHNDGNNANGDARADALAAIVVTLTRVNSVFENEMSMRFTLVANNANVIYFNGFNAAGNSDPYDNYSGIQMLDENTNNLNNIIGSTAYDIGHVFSTGGGGIAGTSPCGSGKGRGVTGIVTPEFDPFDIDYVCHEIGHQYGASHTFYNGCFGGSPSSTPVEAGSASTIMGYAGICAPNVQDNSDAYFHVLSLIQMQASINIDTCDQQVSLGTLNPSAPNAENLANRTIPRSTPFKLTSNSAQIADPNEVYTYNWEQYDTGTAAATGATQPPLSTNTSGPMFRSKFATTSDTQYFPNLNDLVNGAIPTWEVLPSVNRTMRFYNTIRDNNPFGGQTDVATVTLTVGTVGPFVVTAPVGSETWFEGQTKTITWNVNGTNNSTFATQVNIKLSLDGGYTYPVTLASNVANNGSQAVTIPTGVLTTSARVMVEAVGNYFFNISPANFTIKEGTFELTATNSVVTTCAPANASFIFGYDAAPGFNQQATFTTTGLPPGLNVVFSTNTTTVDASITATIQGTTVALAGQYAFKVRATTTSATIERDFTLKIFNTIVGDVLLTAPLNGAGNQAANPLLQWDDIASASSYLVEVSTVSSFNSIIESATVMNATSFQPTLLATGNLYYWRVRPSNGCNAGQVASIATFQTAQDVCNTYTNEYFENNDNTWESNIVNAVSARMMVPDDIEITNVSFYMRANHNDTGDIKMQFSAPSGRFSEVYNRECAAGTGFNLTVSDQGTQNFGCAPGFAGILTGNQRPGQAFSRFNGLSAQGEWVLLATDRTAGTGGTFNEFSITVCGRLQYVNDLNNDVNTGIVLAFNGTATINQTALRTTKTGTTDVDMVYVVTQLPKLGTLSWQGSPLALGSTFTQADLNNNSIAYQHTSTQLIYNDSFDYVVQGQNNILNNAATFSVVIDEPTLIFNTASWTPFAPSMETGALNAIVLAGSPSLTTNAQVKDLAVQGTANELLLSATLTVSGDITLTGTINARNGGTLILDSTLPQTINGSAGALIMTDHLTVINTAGVTLNTPLDVYGIMDTANATFTANGNLTFKSNAAGTGQLADATGATVIGAVNVERFITAKRAFRFLASAVNSTNTIYQNWQENGTTAAGLGTHITGAITGANGFDATASGNPSMFGYDYNAQNWFAIANTNTQVLRVGDAWRILVRGDRNTNLASNTATASNTTLRANGALHLGDFTTSFTTVANDFAFIANPYQAAVDLKITLTDAATQGINPNFIYVWDPNMNIRGAYVTVDMRTANGNAVPVASQANKYVQPGQSFFVQTTGAASLTFRETAKAPLAAQTTVFSTPAAAAKISVTLLDDATGDLKDQVITSFDTTHANGVDGNDALKFVNIDETLAIMQGSNALAIENRLVPQNNEITELTINRYRGTVYRFIISLENLATLQAVLVDRYLNTETSLAAGVNMIAFTVNNQAAASTAANRFAIKYTTGQLSSDAVALQQDVRLYPNPSSGGYFEITSTLLTGEQVAVCVYNTLGQLIHRQEFVAEQTVAVRPELNLAAGSYIVRITTATQQAALQLLVQ